MSRPRAEKRRERITVAISHVNANRIRIMRDLLGGITPCVDMALDYLWRLSNVPSIVAAREAGADLVSVPDETELALDCEEPCTTPTEVPRTGS